MVEGYDIAAGGEAAHGRCVGVVADRDVVHYLRGRAVGSLGKGRPDDEVDCDGKEQLMAEQPVVAPVPTHSAETGDKGLKTGALGFISSVVIGVASTAPGYSLAASLGLVVGGCRAPGAGDHLVAFVPMCSSRRPTTT